MRIQASQGEAPALAPIPPPPPGPCPWGALAQVCGTGEIKAPEALEKIVLPAKVGERLFGATCVCCSGFYGEFKSR